VYTVFTYLLAPLSIAASVFAYKSIAAVASIALVAVVWHCARLRGNNPVRAAALVGLNPLLLVYGVGGAHNDLLMLLVAVGGLYAILASRERLGGSLTMLAVGIKLTAGLVVPFALVAGGPRRGRGRRDLLIGAGAGLAAIVTLGLGVFGWGSLNLFSTVNRAQNEGGWQSLPGFITSRLGMPGAGTSRRTSWRPGSWRSAAGCCDGCGAGRWTGSTVPRGRCWRCSPDRARCCRGTWRGCCRWRRSGTTAGWCGPRWRSRAWS
jgi:hypothetical protein